MELTLKDVLSERRLNCPICNYKATCSCKSQSHIENHTDPLDKNLFKCFFCGQQVTTLLRLREHMFVHGDQSEKLKCFACNVFCKSEVDFKDHIWLHQSLCKQTFKCIYCDRETCSVNTMKMHMLKHKNYIAVQECCLCHYKSKSRGDLLRHFATHKISNSAMLICSFCEYKTKHLSDLKLHLPTHKDRIEVFKCCVCNYECFSKVGLTKHFLIHKNYSKFNSFKCPFCNYTANYLGEFRSHMLKHNRSSNTAEFCVCVYKCHLCDYKTNKERDYKSHYRDSHKNFSSDTICVDKEPSETTQNQNKINWKLLNIDSNICGTFKPLKTSQWQVESTGSKDYTNIIYKCIQCTFQTKLITDLKGHEEVHKNHSESQFPTINISLDERYLQNIVSNNQSIDKPQTNSLEHLVDLTFLNTSQNETSVQKQNNEVSEKRKFQCDECSFTTTHRQRFSRHKDTHKNRSERKLFRCSTCDATFTAQFSLKQHMLLHVNPNEKPTLSCEVFEYKTLYRSNLNNHIISKHSDRINIQLESVDSNEEKTNNDKTEPSQEIQLTHSESNVKELITESRAISEKISLARPRYQCEECCFCTNKYDTLKRHKDIHKDRSARKLFRCTTCGIFLTTEHSLKRHNFIHMDPNERPMLSCERCEYKTLYGNSLKSHIKTKHSDGTKLQLESGEKIDNVKSVRNQETLHTEPEFVAVKNEMESDTEETVGELPAVNATISFEMTEDFSLKEHTSLHMDPEEKAMLCCDMCEYKTLYRHCLNEHIEIKHLERTDLQLDSVKSDRSRISDNISQQEQETQHTEPEFVAIKQEIESGIGESFNELLATNKDESSKALEYCCDECSFCTVCHDSFKIHKNIHKDRCERILFNCTTSGTTFPTQTCFKASGIKRKRSKGTESQLESLETNTDLEFVTVKQETEANTEELCSDTSAINEKVPLETSDYQCGECSFYTTNHNTLKRHRETHKDRSKRKLSQCTICDATFTTKSSLKHHTLLHIDPNERPMLHCERCEYKTINRGNLKKHVRTVHLKQAKLQIESTEVKEESGMQKVYKCKECLFETRFTTSLKRHEEIHKDRSERQLYECATCRITCTTKNNLKDHIFLAHMDTNH